MELILKNLQDFSAKEVTRLLNNKQDIDNKAGIIIVSLTVEELRNDDGQIYKFFAARVLPKSINPQYFVNPHYHLHGQEPYFFLHGEKGEMNSGFVEGNEVIWSSPKLINTKDVYVVKEREIHSFRNIGNDAYDFVFACPQSHLIDYELEKNPEGDRYFVGKLKNPLPPQY